MTTPVAHDYPDWGRQQAASDILVASHSGVNLAAALVDPIRFVGQYPYVYVRGIGFAVPYSITLDWFYDNAGVNSAGFDVVNDRNVFDSQATFPVRAPFLRVTTELSAYPGLVSSFVHMTPTPLNIPVGSTPQNVLIDQLNGGPLGGGANTVVAAQAVRGGPAYFEADLLGATNFVMYLYTLNHLGGRSNLASVYPASRGHPRNLYLPPSTVEVQIFNQDAVAHDYRVLLSYNDVAS